MGGINEYIEKFSIDKQTKILNDMNLHWTSSREVLPKQVVMRFHLDRDKSDSDYGYNTATSPKRIFKQTIKRYLVLCYEVPELIRARKQVRS